MSQNEKTARNTQQVTATLDFNAYMISITIKIDTSLQGQGLTGRSALSIVAMDGAGCFYRHYLRANGGEIVITSSAGIIIAMGMT